MDSPHQSDQPLDMQALRLQIEQWAHALGFNQIGVSDIDLASQEAYLLEWLQQGFHGAMDYMAKHGKKRSRPADLVPGTVSVISVRMNYFPPNARDAVATLQDDQMAYISRYAMGRDYHKVMRQRLQQLSDQISAHVQAFSYRVFTDSAPVMEVALAEKAGLGWRGKHTLLLSRDAGSWFFLGEIYTNLPLPTDQAQSNHCGHCTACISVCPTQAIVAPYRLDARRCISYLTIEHKTSIPLAFRRMIGNRVYGCDDCQLACPWNRFAQLTAQEDFQVRHGLDQATLVDLFAWSEETFHARMAGSAIYRIGYSQWLRNLAVGLGNARTTPEVVQALQARRDSADSLVREHIDWALQQHQIAL